MTRDDSRCAILPFLALESERSWARPLFLAGSVVLTVGLASIGRHLMWHSFLPWLPRARVVLPALGLVLHFAAMVGIMAIAAGAVMTQVDRGWRLIQIAVGTGTYCSLVVLALEPPLRWPDHSGFLEIGGVALASLVGAIVGEQIGHELLARYWQRSMCRSAFWLRGALHRRRGAGDGPLEAD